MPDPKKTQTISWITSVAVHATLVAVIVIGERSTPAFADFNIEVELIKQPVPAAPIQKRRQASLKPKTSPALAQLPTTAATTSSDSQSPSNESESNPDLNNSAAPTKLSLPSLAQSDPYFGRLFGRLQRAKFYPFEARRLRHFGQVEISFEIHRDGKISNIQLSKKSESPILDEAALESVRRIRRHQPLPQHYLHPFISVTVPFVFSLNDQNPQG